MSNEPAYRATQDHRRSPLVAENRSRSYRPDRSYAEIPVSLSVVKRTRTLFVQLFLTRHCRIHASHDRSSSIVVLRAMFMTSSFLVQFDPNLSCDRFQTRSRVFNTHDDLLFPIVPSRNRFFLFCQERCRFKIK